MKEYYSIDDVAVMTMLDLDSLLTILKK